MEAPLNAMAGIGIGNLAIAVRRVKSHMKRIGCSAGREVCIIIKLIREADYVIGVFLNLHFKVSKVLNLRGRACARCLRGGQLKDIIAKIIIGVGNASARNNRGGAEIRGVIFGSEIVDAIG